MPLRKALLTACLALPLAGFAGAAQANSAHAERIIRVPAGSVVLVLPAATPMSAADTAVLPAFPADFPVLHMMAEQQAMMRTMMRQMQVLDGLTLSMPGPAQVIRSVLDGMPQQRLAPGTSMVTSVVSDGHGVCRQTITYRATANGAQPQVHVVRTGNDCGALHVTGPIGVTQTLPGVPSAHSPTIPAAAPNRPQLWTVGYPPRPMTAGAPRS